MALAERSDPKRERWERMTLDQIREVFGEEQLDAGLEPLREGPGLGRPLSRRRPPSPRSDLNG
jgi:hypothetical protein